jgi:hypothetical protein
MTVGALHVQLLTFEGCPLADAAKIELEAALAECGIEGYEAIDILDPKTPETLRGWGSPTILVNGIDIAGQPKRDGIGCRMYPGKARVPDRAEIVSSIKEFVRASAPTGS